MSHPHYSSHGPGPAAAAAVPQRLAHFLERDELNQSTNDDDGTVTHTRPTQFRQPSTHESSSDSDDTDSDSDEDDSTSTETSSSQSTSRSSTSKPTSNLANVQQRLAAMDIGLGGARAPNHSGNQPRPTAASSYLSPPTSSPSASSVSALTHPSALALPISPRPDELIYDERGELITADPQSSSPSHASGSTPLSAEQRARRLEEMRRVTEAQEEELAFYAAAAAAAAASSASSPKNSAVRPVATNSVSPTTTKAATPSISTFSSNSTGIPASASSTAPPSTLSVLHSLQRYSQLCSHLNQSLSHYVQSQSQSLIELEESLQRSRFIEWMLRLVKDGSIGGAGGTPSGLGSMFSIFTAFTAASTQQLLDQYSINSYNILFDKRKIVIEKPFGYAQEVEYKRLIHILRARPSLLAFALASFQWQLIQPSSAATSHVLSSQTPLIDPAAIASHKRSMDSVAKCCVWDLFGSSSCSSSSEAASEQHAMIERKVSYMIRMTLKIMWEKETNKIKEKEKASGGSTSSAAQAYAALASGAAPPPTLPLQLFEHHAFLPKLFHEYNLYVGGEFLRRCLKDILHIVILYDDGMDLNADLTGMVPPDQGELEMLRVPPTPSTSSPFADFPPPTVPPPSAHCSATRTPPFLHGRPSNNLYDLCLTLLERFKKFIDLIPRGMRKLGREIARLIYLSEHPSIPSTTPLSATDLLPVDPNFEHVSTRVLSDYFFLNWIVNAIMFPENYTIGSRGASASSSSSLTENYPLSSLAKRNLQAIGTVLIKLTSGSRFSPFSNGPNSSPAKLSQHPTTRLDQFLEIHQPEIIDWLRDVITIDESGEEERIEFNMFESNDLESSITIPGGWKSENVNWSSHESSTPDAELNPIMMLPNDLFAIHGLMKGCWNAAVTIKIATTPSKRKNLPATGQPTPIPIAKLPFPTFPICLQTAAGIASNLSSLNGLNPYSLEILTLLISTLSSLGDVANFVPSPENIYVLLDSGFIPLKMPSELVKLRHEWPFDSKVMKHAQEILIQTLTMLPTFPEDSLGKSTKPLKDIFHELESRFRESSPSMAAQIASTYDILDRHLSQEWKQNDFRLFLLAILQSLIQQHEFLLRSSTISSRMLLNYGIFTKINADSARKDANIIHQFKLFQFKRLLELTRPKIRRLKKFLAIKADPKNPSNPQANNSPSPPTPNDLPVCSGNCPDNTSQDRFLCTGCTLLIQRRGGLLRSFIAKYVIGDGVVMNQAGSAPTTYISVGIGPPLDIKDSLIASDISDYILSSAYPELFVQCSKADDMFYSHLSRLTTFFDRNFIQFYMYMQLMDLMSDATKAYEVWRDWKEKYQAEQANSPDYGSQLGLVGHPPITLNLPGSAKSKTIRFPYLGVQSVSQSYRLLRSLDSEIKPKKKLDVCMEVRSILLTTLGNMSWTDLSSEDVPPETRNAQQRIHAMKPFDSSNSSTMHFHPLHPHHHTSSPPDDVEAGSIEDYMSAMCFVLLISNPPFFISNLQFLKSLFLQSASVKGFVDLIVSMKYLDGVWTNLSDVIRAQDLKEEQKRREERLEQERRDAHARAEDELRQQAQELSKQIQAIQRQPSPTGHEQHPQGQTQPPTLPPRTHLNGMGPPVAASIPIRPPATAASSPLPTANPVGVQPPPPLSHQQDLALRTRLVQMGFPDQDIIDGLHMLTHKDRINDTHMMTTLLDYIGVLGEVVRLGYERHLVVAMIRQFSELQYQVTTEQVQRQLEANGIRRG